MTIINYKRIKHGLIAALALFLVISGCSTESNGPIRPAESAEDRHAKILEKIPQVYELLTKVQIANEGAIKLNNGKNDGFDFGTPSSGFDFSNPSGNTYTTDEGIVVIATPGFGSNAGGGIITAGSSDFNIDYTFCISAGEEGEGSELASAFSDGIDGVSFVIGISGDPSSEDSNESNPFGGLKAMALYVVFDSEAQGSYDVINFFDLDNEDLEDINGLSGQAYAYIFDFEGGKLFISSEGSMNVNGGTIDFQGEYLQIDFDIESMEDLEEPEDFKFVQGAGSMGCN